MRITVTRSGGEAGVREQLGPVDTEDLESDLGDEIVSAVEEAGFFDLPGEFEPGGAFDLFQNTMTVVDGERSHRVAWWDDSPDRPAALSQLVVLVRRSGQEWRNAPPDGGEDDNGILAVRSESGGFAGTSETLTVFDDGRVHFSDGRSVEDQRTVPAESLQPLRDILASERWQALAGIFGVPVADGFTIHVSAGGITTGFFRPSARPVEFPAVLREVMALLSQL